MVAVGPSGTSLGLPREYQLALHFVRDAAAQIVLLGHALRFLRFESFEPPHLPLMQNLGVVAFFFISGIVIAAAIDRDDVSFRGYMWDRITRIFVPLIPALFFVLAVDLCIKLYDFYPAAYRNSLNVSTFVANALLIFNYPSIQIFGYTIDLSLIEAGPLGSIRPLWTIVIEFWIYVFVGYLALRKSGGKLARALALLLFIYAIPVILENAIGGRGRSLTLIWLTGAAFYYAVSRTDILKWLERSWWLLVGATILMFLTSPIPKSYSLTYNLIACLAIVSFLEGARRFGLFARLPTLGTAAKALASYSYSLYLVHYTILLAVIGLLVEHMHRGALLVLVLVLCNVIAIAFWWLFENRYHYVRQLFRQRPAVQTPSPSPGS